MKTRGTGALTIYLTFCQMKLISFMDNGNVAEVTSLQSAICLKFGRSPEKVLPCVSLDYMLSLKVG